MKRFFLFALFFLTAPLVASVHVGADVLFESGVPDILRGKRIGLITNQSAINQKLNTTFSILKEYEGNYTLVAVFAPEHGYYGDAYACEQVEHRDIEGVPLYSLHGKHRRPDDEMLGTIDLLIYDIQDIGSRSYTYISTLFYCMEEAAARDIPVLVLDRPNPMGGMVVDGPLIEEKWRSFLGYINIPYCHGMTVGELAQLFNQEYDVECDLTVVEMRGWKRGMTFAQTGLPWVPTSPQIPEPDTPFFYPTTGILGHFSLVNIGVGYTLPFKLVGAPWIGAEKLAAVLNENNLPGVRFQPYYFRPFFGKFKLENCQGVRVIITNPNTYLPITTQFTVMGVLKNLYPHHFEEAIGHVVASRTKREVFNKLNGSEEVLNIIQRDPSIIWKLRGLCVEARDTFLPVREKYLISTYK